MKIRIRNIVAPLVLAGGLAASALTGSPAMASEAACQVQNGCGTLHSVNAAGTPVVLDAKRQADLGEDIGYADLIGDRASSFSLVQHEGRGRVTYTDKTFTGAFTGIDNLTVSVGGGSISFKAVAPSAETTDTYSVGLSGLPALPSTVALTQGTGPAGGIFTGSTAVPAYLHPGTYTVGVTLTDTPLNGTPVVTTGILTLTVTGNVVFVPAQPFYTIVYVTAQGNWTSDCVTALGNGLLKNEPCTLGKDPSQMFRFFTATVDGPATTLSTGSVSVPFVASAQQYAVLNVATGKYLEDQSILSAQATMVPQSDPADAVVGTGRELDANGSAAAGLATWQFGV